MNTYTPDDDATEARTSVIDAITEVLREVELKKHLAVQATAHVLDANTWWTLATASQPGGATMKPRQSIIQALMNDPYNRSITHLLQLGALETEYPQITAESLTSPKQELLTEIVRYRITPFGQMVINYALGKMEGYDPEVQRVLETLLASSQQPTNSSG